MKAIGLMWELKEKTQTNPKHENSFAIDSVRTFVSSFDGKTTLRLLVSLS